MRHNETRQYTGPHHELRELAAQDARGLISEDEAAWLREPARLKDWRSALLELKLEVEAQAVEKKAKVEAFQQECFAKGPKGKSEWFAYKAEYEAWRARSRRVMTGVQNRLRENKVLLDRAEEGTEIPRLRARVGRLKRQLRKAHDFMVDDSHITFRAQDIRDGLLEDFRRELEGQDA